MAQQSAGFMLATFLTYLRFTLPKDLLVGNALGKVGQGEAAYRADLRDEACWKAFCSCNGLRMADSAR